MEFEKLFIESKGQPIAYKGKILKMVERIVLKSQESRFRFSILSTDSIYTQGVILQTNGSFEVNGQTISKRTVFWEDTCPSQVDLKVVSKDQMLLIYNAWRNDGVVHYWHNGGALFTEERDEALIFNCNDGYPDDDFDDLVFQLEEI